MEQVLSFYLRNRFSLSMGNSHLVTRILDQLRSEVTSDALSHLETELYLGCILFHRIWRRFFAYFAVLKWTRIYHHDNKRARELNMAEVKHFVLLWYFKNNSSKTRRSEDLKKILRRRAEPRKSLMNHLVLLRDWEAKTYLEHIDVLSEYHVPWRTRER